MPRNCATPNCERSTDRPGDPESVYRWCDDCTAIVLRTGRPPVLPVKFQPRWLKNLQAKDMTGRAAA